jgi:hypothetical protein
MRAVHSRPSTALVAQWIELGFPKPGVAGSIPAGGTTQMGTVAALRDRFAGHPFDLRLRFTSTSSSRLNLVERWFRELTDKALRRGSFNSVPDLIDSIEEYMDAHNGDPKPFVWTPLPSRSWRRSAVDASPSKSSTINETHH